jgi:NADH dehydrogenase
VSRIAITGGTGFVGGHLAERLRRDSHEVVVIGRRAGIDVTDTSALARAFEGCEAVVHCAGINREIGRQTYRRVHVDGTEAVVDAAEKAGVSRLVMLSFLRARPDGPTTYHRSKWAAEVMVRNSGLSWTVLKAGVIYGRGDHLLDHVSRAIQTVPLFGLVGLRATPVRPVAVDDVTRLLAAAALGDARLARRTVAVLGPETLSLEEAVRRIGRAAGRRPRFVRLPVIVHRWLARLWESAMRVPLLSRAQVEILAEGVVEQLPFAEEPPADLRPQAPFSQAAIRAGLPPPGRFGLTDLRCWPVSAA